jgi:hypothetical protein
LESWLALRTKYRAIVHAGNHRGLAFWTRHGFEVVGEVDAVEHFTEYRNLSFDRPSLKREPALLLRRVAGEPIEPDRHPVDR